MTSFCDVIITETQGRVFRGQLQYTVSVVVIVIIILLDYIYRLPMTWGPAGIEPLKSGSSG